MAWHLRFWRRIRLAPGLTLNLSRRSGSVSAGPRGSRVTVGRKGIRQTIGLPGTGLFATNYRRWPRRPATTEREITSSAEDPTPTPTAPRAPVTCDFCGGAVSVDGRCTMCGQIADQGDAGR